MDTETEFLFAANEDENEKDALLDLILKLELDKNDEGEEKDAIVSRSSPPPPPSDTIDVVYATSYPALDAAIEEASKFFETKIIEDEEKEVGEGGEIEE